MQPNGLTLLHEVCEVRSNSRCISLLSWRVAKECLALSLGGEGGFKGASVPWLGYAPTLGEAAATSTLWLIRILAMSTTLSVQVALYIIVPLPLVSTFILLFTLHYLWLCLLSYLILPLRVDVFARCKLLHVDRLSLSCISSGKTAALRTSSPSAPHLTWIPSSSSNISWNLSL